MNLVKTKAETQHALVSQLRGLRERLHHIEDTEPAAEGQLRRIVGTLLEAEGCKAAIGAYCEVETLDGQWLETEVVGFASDHLLLMPTGELRGVMPHARVRPIRKSSNIAVGDGLLTASPPLSVYLGKYLRHSDSSRFDFYGRGYFRR